MKINKMPEFYMTIARKKYFPRFFAGARSLPPVYRVYAKKLLWPKPLMAKEWYGHGHSGHSGAAANSDVSNCNPTNPQSDRTASV